LVASGGGRQIVETLYRVAEDAGVDIVYGAQAIDASRAVDGHATTFRLNSGAVCVAPSTAIVFATGGFHSSAEMRAQYLGAGWELAKVRGSQFSNGDGASIGRRMGARLAGHWSGCHAVAWEPNAPDPERLETAGMFNRDSFPFSIMVNERGERFLDEGSDFRYRMYSKNGRHILAQPSQVAWQVFDGSMADLLLDSYHNRYATKVQAQTIEELAAKMDGVDASALVRTIEQFNAAIPSDAPEFAPHVKDGRGTVGLALPKSNWAVPFLQPPFRAYQVTAGITFTFAGLAIDGDSRVIGVGPLGRTMPGLYAAGEAAGGLFYFSYPAGSALTTAAVFGRVAGRSAVKDIRAAVSS
jgi:tricarballylate dehydrogenase